MPSSHAERTLVVPPEGAGCRLDRILASALPEFSRTRLKALIEQGHVRVGERTITDANERVKSGQAVRLALPPPQPAGPRPQRLPLAIVYEDADLLVLDKPAGLVVHPAAGNPDGTLVNALLAHAGDSLSGVGGVARPGIVHRLDKDTTGLLVVAKHDRAHRGLARQFARHSVERAYHCFCIGCPLPAAGRIEGAIARHPVERQRRAVVREGGKAAVTHYRQLACYAGQAALLECRLETGRTHQIRVHLAHLGHPLLGDALYAGGRGHALATKLGQAMPRRQALHAWLLGFRHPVTGQRLRFESPLPADLLSLKEALGRLAG